MQKPEFETESTPPSGTDKTLPLSSTWREAAEQLIEDVGTVANAAHFAGKVFRKQFFPEISRVYFDELLAQAKLHEEAVVEKLGLHASTLTKWSDHSNPAGANKFFAVLLLVMKKNLNAIPFPDRGVMLFRAIRRQLKRFAEDYCEPPQCAMDRLVFRSLVHAMGHASSERLVPGTKVTDAIRARALADSVRTVNGALKRDYGAFGAGKAPVVDAERLSLWLSSWGMPYTLLALGTEKVLWEMNDV